MNRSTPIRNFLNALVHPSAHADPLSAERHVAFMAPRLVASLLALGLFPVYLALHGVPSVLEFFALTWMILPLAAVSFLSRTGRYDAAHVLSALALTSIVTIVAANSGGMNSFAAIWFALVPLEAALSGSRRAVAVAALLAIGGVGLLLIANSWLGLGPDIERPTGALTGTISAVIYATGIAFGADSLVRLGCEAHQRRLDAFCPTDVVTHHGDGGRIVFASANAQAVLGATAADLKSDGLFDRIHVADRPAYLRALSEAASGDTSEIEFRLRRQAEAEFVWIEMRCRPSNGNIARVRDAASPKVVAVMRDVTARKIRQDVLIAARAEAERANAAKSRFLALVSHELRTPLNAVIGFSDMLRNEGGNPVDGTRRLEYARIINESGHHLLAVANEILDLSRLETGNFGLDPEPLRLDAVVAGCADVLALRAQEAGVTVKVEVPSGLPDIVADRRAMMQIVINLITNAIKFSHRGGTVTVCAGVDGPHVWLEVADAGIGIAPDDLARIGNPFFQVRSPCSRRHDGAGLGLSIVRGLVDLHGGELKAESKPGEGTRMVVRLPIDGAYAAGSPRLLTASGIHRDIPMGLGGGLPTSPHMADPCPPRPAAIHSPANLRVPVQRRA